MSTAVLCPVHLPMGARHDLVCVVTDGAGGAEHGIRNTADEPLRFIHAFATDSVEDVVYRFSAEA